jgi:hypothetical protein
VGRRPGGSGAGSEEELEDGARGERRMGRPAMQVERRQPPLASSTPREGVSAARVSSVGTPFISAL